MDDQAAVFFHCQPSVSAGKLEVFLDFETRSVAVAGTEQITPGLRVGNPEGNDGASAPADIVAAPGLQIPVVALI